MANRVDAAHGQKPRRRGVRSADVFKSEFTAFRIAGESRQSVDTVEDVPSRGCVTPSLGWRKSGSGHVGLLRKRRSKGDGFGASDGCASIRRMSRRSQDRRRKSGTLVKTTCATSSRRMVPNEGACRRQGMSEVGGFRGEGSLSGNNAQRVSVQEHRKVRLKRELGFVKEHGFG